MLSKCFVVALVAVGFAASASIEPRTADRDVLVKQKKIFDLLMYVDKDVLNDAEYFELGRRYDIMANIEHYTDKEVVMDFLYQYKMGMLKKDGIFTYYNQEHREEMMLLYRLFYSAKDFMTFYKTACWARIYLNSGLFTTAFTTAVIYRDDTKYIRLPAIYEIYPNMFFDSKVIREAQRIGMTRGSTKLGYNLHLRDTDADSIETYHLYSNLTDLCMNPMYSYETKLAYFTEDVGLNAFYYYFRMMFPFWMNTNEYNVPKSMRGDLYYFVHQQLMARYYLERISNGLGEIEDFSWNRMYLPGFYSNILYTNGYAMPKRDMWYMVPMYKLKYLDYLKKLEMRIMEAIDSGFVMDKSGKEISLMTEEGLNLLGNLIEGNYDSINLQYYGSYDVLARDILGMNMNIKNKNYYVPSSLEYFSTSMKDPAFYRLYDRIVQYFLRYKSLLKYYTKNELEFNGVKIENVEIDKLYTYFDAKDYLVNNAVDVPTMKEGKSFNIKTWQYQLNYKPFTYKFAINSERSSKAVLRIFLGPAIEGEKYDDYSYLLNYYQYFFMLDEFEVNLREGLNNIQRLSTDSITFKKEYMTGDKFYKQIVQAMEGKHLMNLPEQMWGFPQHLMLPKGTVDGMRFKLFFYIGQYEDSKIMELPILGKFMWYGKSLGFPLDRPMQPWFLNLDNVYLKDVFIYNIVDPQMMGGQSRNMMMNYESMMRMRDTKDMDMMRMKNMRHMDTMHMENLRDMDSMRENVEDYRMRHTESMGSMKNSLGMMRNLNMM